MEKLKVTPCKHCGNKAHIQARTVGNNTYQKLCVDCYRAWLKPWLANNEAAHRRAHRKYQAKQKSR